jgi:predicted nucleic acid-binding protein
MKVPTARYDTDSRCVRPPHDSRSGASFVDHVSFVLMRARGVTTAFAFDEDFARQGFNVTG